MEDVATSGTEAEMYAESVVRDVIANREGTIWRGAFAGTLRWLKLVVPGFVLVSFVLFFGILGFWDCLGGGVRKGVCS